MDNTDILKKRIEWMQCDNRTNELYINGVKEFLDFAFSNASSNHSTNDEDEEPTVPCPCYTCNNKRHKKRDEIFEDLMVNGIVRGYIRWVYHGESKTSLKRPRTELGGNNDDIISMIRESRDPIVFVDALDEECENTNDDCQEEEPHKKHVNEPIIYKLVNDAQLPLYPGCEELSKLSFILKLFQIKCMDGMTNKAFSSILKLFKNTLPKGADVPSSYYEARKLITDLGFNYIKIEACKVKKTRGLVYCKKLTELAPGEKIFIEFNEDGIPIGDYSTTFSYFIGDQVRNRSVCPVQVSEWEDYTSETLDHLWRCILEKCDFDNPELRKEGIMKHARDLFRDSRHKLRRKYIIQPNFTTKEDQLKNKPKDMLKADWKYLVELWRTPKFLEKSEKAKRSRSFQKMPHYTGSKSHARVKEDIKQKNGGKCSRVDMLLETRQRTSEKSVDSINLACNMHAIEEVKKLKKERDEGLNQKTDDEIIAEVLGKDSHGYLRCYGRGKSITEYFGVKPSRLDLANEVILVKRTTTNTLEEAKKEVEAANKNAEEARKDAEIAKKEAEAARNEVDEKIAANNKIWEERFAQLMKLHGIGSSHKG